MIRRLGSDLRNPIRAIEKPNGSVRLVCNFISLIDFFEKDSYELANNRDVVGATQGSELFTVINLRTRFTI